MNKNVSHKFILSLFAFFLIFLAQGTQASYDRIRIEIKSSSDWTILKLMGNATIVNAKTLSIEGSSTLHWSSDSLIVNQPFDEAQSKHSVKGQFDIIIESNNVGNLLTFESTKGDFGIISIDFYHWNTDIPKLISSVNNINSGGHPNTKVFDIDAVSLFEGDFGFTRSNIPPLIFAFYYPWYSLDSWGSPILGDNPLKPYSSDDMSAISHHVHLAKQAGIDGFISSWWGPGDYTDENLKKLLQISENMDFKVSIYFETLTGNPSKARPEGEIISWLRYFIQNYGDDSRFFHFDGKPVIFIWAAEALSVDIWKEIFDTLRSEGHEAIYSANSLNPDYLLAFDGLHDYGSAFRANIDDDFKWVSTATKTYGWLDGKSELKIWSATAQPGYDDTRIPDRAGAVLDRKNGELYSQTFESSIKSEPDWILITSFNEWWEHTHIEPSKNYGNTYLELTAKYADIFKGVKVRPPVDFYVPPISEPDGTIHLTWKSPFAQIPDSYNVYRSSQSITSVANLTPIKIDIKDLLYVDLPSSEGRYYYAVTAVLAGVESSLSETASSISSSKKSWANLTKEIPIDIAIYNESTGWIPESEAIKQSNILIELVKDKVNSIDVVGSEAMPSWVLSHIKNNQPDIILTFGDFPDSIYPSGNKEPDGSLAEAFLDDGNIIINTADYMFFGKGRNASGGLINMMDIVTTMWGDNTSMTVIKEGAKFTPSLKNFVSDRPFHLDELEGTDWEAEVIFADNGNNRADPVIVYNSKTGGRIGIVYQKADDSLPRGKVIGEVILNWLPTIFSSSIYDVNNDMKIDVSDIKLAGINLGRKTNELIFPKLDVNKDGIVNIYDIILIAFHFGNPIK